MFWKILQSFVLNHDLIKLSTRIEKRQRSLKTSGSTLVRYLKQNCLYCQIFANKLCFNRHCDAISGSKPDRTRTYRHDQRSGRRRYIYYIIFT